MYTHLVGRFDLTPAQQNNRLARIAQHPGLDQGFRRNHRVLPEAFEAIKIDGPADRMVSPKTVQFYLDVEDIAISVETSVPVAT
jgi:hypothetical protein